MWLRFLIILNQNICCRYLKRTVSKRRFFWAPQTQNQTIGLENIHNCPLKLLSTCTYVLEALRVTYVTSTYMRGSRKFCQRGSGPLSPLYIYACPNLWAGSCTTSTPKLLPYVAKIDKRAWHVILITIWSSSWGFTYNLLGSIGGGPVALCFFVSVDSFPETCMHVL